jgi:hemolysin III
VSKAQDMKTYSALEERINIGSHAVGLVLSVFALIALLIRAFEYSDRAYLFSFSLFGLSLIALYAASTAYHAARAPLRRQRLRIIDHAAIYVLIAGTYTPFTLITLAGTTEGWVIFFLTWLMALCGIILKLFFTGRYTFISTAMYVLMGWIIVFAINPLLDTLPALGLEWLIAGGLAYTVGALVYAMKQIKYNHAIFHIFILMGSTCHFIAIYFFV